MSKNNTLLLRMSVNNGQENDVTLLIVRMEAEGYNYCDADHLNRDHSLVSTKRTVGEK